jgi:hypothetical protein
MFHITRSDILSLVFFITSTRSYVSFANSSYHVTRKKKQQLLRSGSIIERKEGYSSQVIFPI